MSHLFRHATEITFSLLFICVAYTAQAQESENAFIQINPDRVAEYITQNIEEENEEKSIETVDGIEQSTTELIIMLDENTSEETVRSIMEESTEIESVLHTEEESYIKVSVPEAEKEAIEERLEENSDIEIEPHYIRRAASVPNDTYYSSQWHHPNTTEGVHDQAAWNTQTGSADVVVAVIDSGVDVDHADLSENMWTNVNEIPDNDVDDDENGYVDDYYGYDFVDDDNDPNPAPDGVDNDDYAGSDTSVDHGTHVAGIIGAQGDNALGVAGVNWDISIMAVRVLDDEGVGTDADIVAGITYATENGADIINLSLGGYGPSALLEDAIEEASRAGVIIIAAAGNDAANIQQYPFYPACYDGDVLAVSSTGTAGLVSSFSNFANGEDCVVDIAAPGELIYSTLYTDDPTYGFTTDYGFLTGTSMATPIVSGVAALLLAQDPTLTQQSVYTLLQDTARDVDFARRYGTGLVDAEAALEAISEAHNPTAPRTIRAYRNLRRSLTVSAEQRTRVQEPLFTWSGASDIEGIAGYYVYFGRNANANPVTDGVFQTRNTYQASGLRGNGRRYYLRIRTKDTDDTVSAETATFIYIVDTRLPRTRRVRVENTSEGVQVQWRKLRHQHIERYIVRRAKKKRHPVFHTIKRVGPRKRIYLDQSAREGVEYIYRIRARDDVGNRSLSRKKTILFEQPQ